MIENVGLEILATENAVQNVYMVSPVESETEIIISENGSIIPEEKFENPSSIEDYTPEIPIISSESKTGNESETTDVSIKETETESDIGLKYMFGNRLFWPGIFSRPVFLILNHILPVRDVRPVKIHFSAGSVIQPAG